MFPLSLSQTHTHTHTHTQKRLSAAKDCTTLTEITHTVTQNTLRVKTLASNTNTENTNPGKRARVGPLNCRCADCRALHM